eukprot:7376409-Prymnesium_polylepis.5
MQQHPQKLCTRLVQVALVPPSIRDGAAVSPTTSVANRTARNYHAATAHTEGAAIAVCVCVDECAIAQADLPRAQPNRPTHIERGRVHEAAICCGNSAIQDVDSAAIPRRL